MTNYFVQTYPHLRAYIPSDRIAVESRDAGDDLLIELSHSFQCASLVSDDPSDPIVIRSNYPNPYFPRERKAAAAWDAKNPDWRELM